MKKKLSLGFLLIICACASCKKPSKQMNVEIVSVVTKGPSQPDMPRSKATCMATVVIHGDDKSVTTETVPVTVETGLAYSESVAKRELRFFVRMSPDSSGVYSIQEYANIDFTHGTPAQYVLESTQQVLAFDSN